jgi:hypothetical protein
MKKLNQKGFGVVEGILIFVAVALIAGTGYYVYKQSQNSDSSKSDQSIAEKSEPKKPKFSEYKNAALGVSLSYPVEWGVATLENGSLLKFQHGEYKHLTFSKADSASINFVTGAYSSPLDACGYDDAVQNAQHFFNSKQASVIGWSGTNIKQYVAGQGSSGPKVHLQSSKAGTTGPGWTKISSKDKVLVYKDIDSADTRFKASSGEVCKPVTQAQADEANAFLSFFHFAVNYSNSKVYGVNAQFDARKTDDPKIRDQLVDALNSLEQ